MEIGVRLVRLLAVEEAHVWPPLGWKELAPVVLNESPERDLHLAPGDEDVVLVAHHVSEVIDPFHAPSLQGYGSLV